MMSFTITCYKTVIKIATSIYDRVSLILKTLFTSMKELSVKDKPADRLNIVVKLEMKTNDV